MSAASLLKSREQCYGKAINNNKKRCFILYCPQVCFNSDRYLDRLHVITSVPALLCCSHCLFNTGHKRSILASPEEQDADDCFYIALFSAHEHTHCAFVLCDSIWVTVAFYSAFWISTKVVYIQCCLVVTWLVPLEAAAVLACSVCSIQPCTMSHHFMQSQIHRVHAYLAVTCHLNFCQNDRDLLHGTMSHHFMQSHICRVHACLAATWTLGRMTEIFHMLLQ